MKQNTIKFIGCGGAGIMLTGSIGKMITDLGSGFAKIERRYVDTSESNIKLIADADMANEFHHVVNSGHSGAVINGSGGERRTNAKEIISSVKEFLDKDGIGEKVTGVYHVVLFSASGGSGSVIGPMIIKNLLERRIPVIGVLVGDSSNGLSAINTLNTIATLNNVAMSSASALSIMYINNKNFNTGSVLTARKDADMAIFNSLSALSLFLNGMNTDLDSQDLLGIIDQTAYSSIQIKPGLYALSTFSKDVTLPQGVIPTVGRTLTIDGVSADIDVNLLHHKVGSVIDENAAAIYKEQFPLHLVTAANFFVIEEQNLKTLTDEYQDIMDNIQVKNITGTSTSEADDSGLVL